MCRLIELSGRHYVSLITPSYVSGVHARDFFPRVRVSGFFLPMAFFSKIKSFSFLVLVAIMFTR